MYGTTPRGTAVLGAAAAIVSAGASGSLARTGVDVTLLLGIAAGLLTGGFALLRSAARRTYGDGNPITGADRA